MKIHKEEYLDFVSLKNNFVVGTYNEWLRYHKSSGYNQ